MPVERPFAGAERLGHFHALRAHSRLPTAVSDRQFPARVFNQSATHRMHRRYEKTGPILPFRLRPADQAQPCLMHQRRGLKGVAGRFPRQMRGRQASQLVIDCRQQRRCIALFAAGRNVRKNRYFAHAPDCAETLLRRRLETIKPHKSTVTRRVPGQRHPCGDTKQLRLELAGAVPPCGHAAKAGTSDL